MSNNLKIYAAATALRQRGHLVDLAPTPTANGGYTFVVDGKFCNLHEFLDLAGTAALPAQS